MPQSSASDVQHTPMSCSSTHPNAQPYVGCVENTVQALRLVYAARLGIIPRIIRRLNDRERREKIASGAVFVFDVAESGMRRWTDGRLWSPSRIDGNFLVYREMNEKNEGSGKFDRFEEWMPGDGNRTALPRAQGQQKRLFRSAGSSVAENVTAGGGLKVGGLVKKTITVKIDGLDHHLIAYYTQQDIDMGRFRRMSTWSDIMSLDLPQHIFCFSEFRIPPRLEEGPNGLSSIVCEPETRLLPVALSDESTVMYPPDRRNRINDVMSLSHWRSNRDVALTAIQGEHRELSIDHTLGQSWQQEFDSLQMALHPNSRHAHWSPMTASLERQQEYQHHYPPYNSTSQDRLQGWPSSQNYHASQYTSSMPSDTAETYFPISQSRDSERGRSSDQNLERRLISGGDKNEARHIGEGEHVWFSAASQEGAVTRFPMPGVYPLTYQQDINDVWPPIGNALFEIQQPQFTRAGESPGLNPYASIQDFVIHNTPV